MKRKILDFEFSSLVSYLLMNVVESIIRFHTSCVTLAHFTRFCTLIQLLLLSQFVKRVNLQNQITIQLQNRMYSIKSCIWNNVLT